MTREEYAESARIILSKGGDVRAAADGLKSLWLKGESKTTNLVKKEARDKLEYRGIAVETLHAIGKEAGKKGKADFERYSALAVLLWDEYGREGRIVAAHILGSMNEAHPEGTIAVCRKLAPSCVSWEECDNLTYGIEPIVRKNPKKYLGVLAGWFEDPCKWVKRAALNVIARLPMKQPAFTGAALSLIVPCLTYDDRDVRRTCSFAIRMSARGDRKETITFLKKNTGGTDPAKIWIFSDVMRSMTKAFLPDFKQLIPAYKKWRNGLSEHASAKSLDAAVSIIEKA
jgi:3-methyladenine DNA glycosylase AlkD